MVAVIREDEAIGYRDEARGEDAVPSVPSLGIYSTTRSPPHVSGEELKRMEAWSNFSRWLSEWTGSVGAIDLPSLNDYVRLVVPIFYGKWCLLPPLRVFHCFSDVAS